MQILSPVSFSALEMALMIPPFPPISSRRAMPTHRRNRDNHASMGTLSQTLLATGLLSVGAYADVAGIPATAGEEGA